MRPPAVPDTGTDAGTNGGTDACSDTGTDTGTFAATYAAAVGAGTVGLVLHDNATLSILLPPLEAYRITQAETWVTEVALALGNAPRLLRRWLTGSLLAMAASALPLAASSSRQ